MEFYRGIPDLALMLAEFVDIAKFGEVRASRSFDLAELRLTARRCNDCPGALHYLVNRIASARFWQVVRAHQHAAVAFVFLPADLGDHGVEEYVKVPRGHLERSGVRIVVSLLQHTLRDSARDFVSGDFKREGDLPSGGVPVQLGVRGLMRHLSIPPFEAIVTVAPVHSHFQPEHILARQPVCPLTASQIHIYQCTAFNGPCR